MRLRRARLRSGSEEGAAAVEFALVVPLLLTLLFGIIEFGTAYNAQILVTNAAREAARAATVADVASTEAQLRARAIAAADAAVEPLGLNVTAAQISFTLSGTATTPSARPCPAGRQLNVSITVAKPLLTGFFGASFDLSGKATRLCAG